MGNAALVSLGILGGVYLLWTIGWIVGGLRLQPIANFLVSPAGFLPAYWLAVLAPAMWFAVVFVATRSSATWIRILWLVVGAILLVPWPFIMIGTVRGMTTMDAAPRASRKTPTWLTATIAGFFGLFYAYAVWTAVALLISQAGDTSGLGAAGWIVLVFAVVFPILVFAGAFALGLRRSPAVLALVLLAGLALTAVFWLNVVAYTLTLIANSAS